MTEQARDWHPEEIVAKHRKIGPSLDTLEAHLTSKHRASFEVVLGRLDRDFVVGQTELIRDLLLDVGHENHANPLLERSVWSALDGLAIHLDESGFTAVFRDMAATLFSDTPLNEPAFVAVETEVVHSFIGGLESEVSVSHLLSVAESHRHGEHGLAEITDSKFTFRAGMQRACARRDGLRTVHAAIAKWVPLITFVANIVFVWIFIPVAILTLVVGWILVLAGC